MEADAYLSKIDYSIQLRHSHLSQGISNAFRLFNGFLEGNGDLLLELFGNTLVIFDYSESANLHDNFLSNLISIARLRYPQITSVILKRRNSKDLHQRTGTLLSGENPAHSIVEHNIQYAVDLLLNQDASFYLDTRNLRLWLKENMHGKSVLNTFAYTGSLGVAARMGQSLRVIQTDQKSQYLDIARKSLLLNNLTGSKHDFIVGDFFQVISQLKRKSYLFDCVIVDPPFFSDNSSGRVDLLRSGEALVNKVRPLVADGGFLVIVNNALFLSGSAFQEYLDRICLDGYLTIEKLIDVPADICGYPESISNSLPVDPSPFNHSTKIVILKVMRKDGLTANITS